MAMFRTAVLEESDDAESRLRDWGLTRAQFIAVARAARSWADDAGPLMPANAPGTLAYIFGVQELRAQLIDEEWRVDRTGGIEAVVNRKIGLRIGFHNVDRACDPVMPPHPRSAKGSSSEMLSGPTLFEHFGVEPGPLPPAPADGISTYYAMVGEDGSVELSYPQIVDGAYHHFNERIFIDRPAGTFEDEASVETGVAEDFEIDVTFKDRRDV
ncbi:hypothetical protein ACVIGA_000920 [Bradyrhizobium sp. USDA 3240]